MCFFTMPEGVSEEGVATNHLLFRFCLAYQASYCDKSGVFDIVEEYFTDTEEINISL